MNIFFLQRPLWRAHTIASLGLLMMLSQYTHAQSLTLNDAVKKALDYYPSIQQRKAELNVAGAHIKTVNAHKLPSLLLSDQVDAGTSNSVIGPYFTMGIIPSTSGSISGVEKTDLASVNVAIASMQLGIYQFGYYNAEKKEAEAAFATSDARLRREEYLLAGNVVSLYLDWLKKYRLMLVQEQNLSRANTILTAIRANVRSGLKPGVDSSTALAGSSRARIAYLQALTAYENDRADIAGYTGMDTNAIKPDTAIFSRQRLDEVLQIAPAVTVPATQPLLDVYQREYEQQIASNSTTAKRYMPKLSLQGAAWARGSSIEYTGAYTSLDNGLSYQRYNYLFGLAATYNITDLRHRHNQLEEGRYLTEAKRASMQAEQTNLNALLLKSNNAYSNTVAQLSELPVLLRSATDAYNQQLTLYRAGLSTLVDVTNALFELQKAETDYVLAQSDLLQIQYLRASLSGQQDSFLQHF